MVKSGFTALLLSLVLHPLPILAQNNDADPAAASALPQASSHPRITAPIDESSLTTLRGNTHPLAQAKYDQGPAPGSMPASRLILVLARSTQQEAALQTYLQSVQDASSPNFHRFLSPEQFGLSFGVGEADLQSIQGWLGGHGFTVNKVSKGRMTIEFSGTVEQVQSAFHTSLHSYAVNGEQFWANAADPQIPSALAPVVSGLASLNSFKPRAQYIRGPSALVDTQEHTVTPTYTFGDATNGYNIFLGPADAATIYNTPTSLNAHLSGTALTGAGATIGIAGVSNIDLTQNANYRATFGLSPNPTTVVVDGADPGENGAVIEAYLDTQVSGGIAPNASVILYTAADTSYQSGLILAILRALDENQADILSVSFSGCESAQGVSGNQFVQNLWEQAAAQGISVTVAAGDNGPAGCDDFNTENVASDGLAVNGLASTPYNIAVGGTDYDILYSNFPASFSTYVDLSNTLSDHRSALSYIPEEPWNDSTIPNTDIAANKPISAYSGDTSNNNIAAGSGGISSVYPVPAWQAGVATGTGRNLPDVSLLAGNGFYGAAWGLCTDQDTDANGNPVPDCVPPTTGNDFYLTGIGGTSASAPAFAGMLALVKQKTGTRLGQADYVLYHLAKTDYSAVFHDVATGDNSVNCQAGSPNCTLNAAGFDFMTGYNATAGYDLASGLGSVNVSQLASSWASAGLIATSSSLELNGATSALKITHGQSVAVKASVTSASGTPSGDIALVDNLSPALQPNSEGITDFTLSGGAASGTTTLLPGGTYQVSAHYGGSSTEAQSDSNAIPVTVGAESSTTTLTVAGYYDPETGNVATTPYYGYIYVLDAQPYGNSASAANPNGSATGTITFKSGSATLGTAALSSEGVAELQTTTLPGGNDSLTAVFPGDASFLASTSAPTSITVIPAVTTLTTPDVYYSGANVLVLTVTLAVDSAGVAPTGKVTFMNGSTSLGSTPLAGYPATATEPAGGSATFMTAPLAPGTYNITDVYSGDGNYGGSTSTPVNVTISKLTANIYGTPASSTILSDQALQLQVAVAPATANTLPPPSGTVTLSCWNIALNASVLNLPAVNLVKGTATVTIPANSLLAGSYNLVLAYSGDANYQANTGNADLTVNPSGTIKPTVTVNAPTKKVTYPFSVSVTVSGPSGDPTPTGLVTLSSTDPSYPPTSLLLANGSASFTDTYGQNGVQETLTAAYLGDSNYTSGSGTSTVVTLMGPSISFTPASPTIMVNQPFNITVTVGGFQGYGTPSGTVTLSSGSYSSQPVSLTAGAASFTIPANSLAIGDNVLLTASYSGDSNYMPLNYGEYVTVTAAPAPGLTITGTAVSVAPGATTGNTSTLTLTPTNGFTGSVALTAAITSSPVNAQYLPTLSFGSTTPVIITNGTSAAGATLTVSTTAASSGCPSAYLKQNGVPWYAAGSAALACVLLVGIPARRRRWAARLGMLALLTALAGGVLACGGSGGGGCTASNNPGTTAGNYAITVTGTSGSTTATGTISLFIQ
ncbi:MAG: Ig-like domain repeat protein [Terracidiphilus sp.]|jgi:subtilase family serine protease